MQESRKRLDSPPAPKANPAARDEPTVEPDVRIPDAEDSKDVATKAEPEAEDESDEPAGSKTSVATTWSDDEENEDAEEVKPAKKKRSRLGRFFSRLRKSDDEDKD